MQWIRRGCTGGWTFDAVVTLAGVAYLLHSPRAGHSAYYRRRSMQWWRIMGDEAERAART